MRKNEIERMGGRKNERREKEGGLMRQRMKAREYECDERIRREIERWREEE